MKDADFMLAVLQEDPGEWVAQHTILSRSISERGCGLTVHSRAASLRKDGHIVDCKVERGLSGRRVSFYRLGVLPQPSGDPTLSSGGSGNDADQAVVPEEAPLLLLSPGEGAAASAGLVAPEPVPLFDAPVARPAWA